MAFQRLIFQKFFCSGNSSGSHPNSTEFYAHCLCHDTHQALLCKISVNSLKYALSKTTNQSASKIHYSLICNDRYRLKKGLQITRNGLIKLGRKPLVPTLTHLA